MIRNIVLYLALFSNIICFSQKVEFEQVTPLLPSYNLIADFEAVSDSDLQFGDIDNDGDEDVIIAGLSGTGDRSVRVYRNDAGVGFRRVWSDSVFLGTDQGTVNFSDVDNDNDLDVLITGTYPNGPSSYPNSSNLYLNDGFGNFTRDLTNTFINVHASAVAFIDIEGDLDSDVIISGRSNSGDALIALYVNDGLGNFSLTSGNPFDSIKYGAIDVADIDNDSDMDIIISGENNDLDRITELYVNDGLGNFSGTLNDTVFDGMKNGDIVFQDVDYNGTADLAIVGENQLGQNISRLYLNNGSGIFTSSTSSTIASADKSSLAFGDVNGDNFADLFIIGQFDTRLYTNNGSGVFTHSLADTVFKSTSNGAIGFSDIDGDNDLDILMTGELWPAGLAEMYYNDGQGHFSFVSGTAFNGGDLVALADIDGDNDLDAFIMGYNYNFDYNSYLYLNDGHANFTPWDSTSILPLQNAAADFADIDGDGDQDLLVCGGLLTSGHKRTRLYTNNGAGVFSLVSGTPFVYVEDGDVEFADIDGDNDFDVLITGREIGSGNGSHSSLYINDGSGNFTMVTGIPLDFISKGAVKFGDIDGDNDLDLVMAGLSLFTGDPETTLYINDGSGNFSLTSDPFIDVYVSSIAIGDIDNDNDNDVIVMGWQSTAWGDRCKIYLNDGSGNFTYLSEVLGSEYGTVLLSDIDNDMDLDMLVTGYGRSRAITKLYINDGTAIFTEQKYTILDQFRKGVAIVANLDTDDKKDVIISGENISRQHVTKLYKNTTCINRYSTDSITTCDSLVWIDGNTYYTSNNTAKDTLVSSLGCDSIISLNLTITNSYTTDSLSVCDSLLWIDGVVYYSSNTTAVHVLSDMNGCDSTVTLNLDVTNFDKTISQSGTTLTAPLQSGVSYQWLDCNNNYSKISGEIGNTFTATMNGDYAVEISNGNCTDTSNCTSIVGLRLDKTIPNVSINVFPNPTTGDVTLAKNTEGTLSIKVYNSLGQIVLDEGKITQKNYQFRIEGSSGVYTLEVASEGALRQYLIIKE